MSKLNLDDICKIYIENPERAIQIVMGNYLCSKDKAIQILNRKCKNMLSEEEYDEFLNFGLSKKSKDEYRRKYSNEIKTKYSVSSGTPCDEAERVLSSLYIKLDEKTLQKTGSTKKRDEQRAQIYIEELNKQISQVQNVILNNRCDELKRSKRDIEEKMLVGQLTQSNKQLQSTGGSNTMIKVVVGVGAILLMGGIFYAIKKSK